MYTGIYAGNLGTVSNRETWEQSVRVVDQNGNAVTITGATITLAVRKQPSSSGDSADLTADTTSGITIATPVFTFRFEVASMRALDPGNYDVGCTILLSGDTTQLIVGTVTVVDGIVS